MGCRTSLGWWVAFVIWSAGAVAQPAGKGGPDLPPQVEYEYLLGTSGAVATANRLTSTVSFTSNSARVWTLVPDLTAFESHETDSIGLAICMAADQPARDQAVPYIVYIAPTDLSGSTTALLVFPAGNNQLSLSFQTTMAKWTVNDEQRLWQPTALARGDRLRCRWERYSTQSFKDEFRRQALYRLNHLGPLVYDAGAPNEPAYVLVSQLPAPPNAESTWCDTAPRWVPLTAAEIQSRVADEATPMLQRVAFLCWLWHQPRPPADADAALIDHLDRPATYPLELRKAAARGLLERRSGAAAPLLLRIAENRETAEALRHTVVRRLHRLDSAESRAALERIARDQRDDKAVRELSLEALAECGETGLAVLRELKDDPQVGPKATEVLAGR